MINVLEIELNHDVFSEIDKNHDSFFRDRFKSRFRAGPKSWFGLAQMTQITNYILEESNKSIHPEKAWSMSLAAWLWNE